MITVTFIRPKEISHDTSWLNSFVDTTREIITSVKHYNDSTVGAWGSGIRANIDQDERFTDKLASYILQMQNEIDRLTKRINNLQEDLHRQQSPLSKGYHVDSLYSGYGIIADSAISLDSTGHLIIKN